MYSCIPTHISTLMAGTVTSNLPSPTAVSAVHLSLRFAFTAFISSMQIQCCAATLSILHSSKPTVSEFSSN